MPTAKKTKPRAKASQTAKSAPKKAPPRGRGAAPRAEKTAAAPVDPKGAYAFFVDRARALGAASVPVSRVEAAIARTNVDRGFKLLTPRMGELKDVAPLVDAQRVANVPALARGVEYADKLVPSDVGDGEIDAKIAVVAPLRRATLAYLEVAAFCGLVDEGRVRAIREGTGRLDLARDAVAIAGLFEEKAKDLAGKHPFTDAQLATLGTEGAWLASVLKPSGAVRDPKKRSDAALMKDRFAKLLDDDWALAGQAAVALLGVDVYQADFPALYARERAPKKKPAPPPPAPPPPAS